ncbi:MULTISPECIES: alpha/beta fold hydrolase [unclassified Sulfitobacter]|uniref:alpha/beta fold hydrolase n=1 Tax=unclassified Sulfitobacter TaxID=196795 RepID=UPI0007C386C3|nr:MULTISPECIES: alpha/beta hydrolase [unclassified Sulfitobacter]KZY04287.1 alpha/beta hydrolase [Sulfitobacter sp. HI0023]KZY24124.1 alpha/beta hydrolase [Sulfitobacter sp. HI0040]KZZ67554.1 alpha/beta hydrolase [Sulfitobacter sp. HI0129]
MMPLVLLPGMMCDARVYAPQIAALSGTRTVHCAPISAHDTTEALAAEVLDQASPRFALAGLSMGGIVAMEMQRQAPGRVAGLALLDTNPKAETDEVRARRRPQMDKVRDGQLALVMRDEMKPNYLTDGPQRAEILDLCMEMALSLGEKVFLNQSRALAHRPDQQDTLRGYDGPALVLCGRDDALCTVARHELMHDLIAGSTLRVIDGAGHLPTLEQPDETTAALAAWLEQTDGL